MDAGHGDRELRRRFRIGGPAHPVVSLPSVSGTGEWLGNF